MSKYFLIKDHLKIEKIAEINNKAHIITDKRTLKLRDSLHSNTFLLYNNHTYTKIIRVFETVPVDYKNIFIEESPLVEIKYTNLENILTINEIEDFARKYFLIQKKEKVAKICNTDVVNLLCYMQTLEDKNDFNLYGEDVKRWALNRFTGSSVEIGYFILIGCYERKMLDSFKEEWRNKDLYDCDCKNLRVFVEASSLPSETKSVLMKYLIKIEF